VPATPPAPTVRSVQKIIVEDLRSEDEGTLVTALKELRFIHLDYRRDDLDLKTAVEEFMYCGGHHAVSWIMEKHPDCKEIQAHGINVFTRATYLDSISIIQTSQNLILQTSKNNLGTQEPFTSYMPLCSDSQKTRTF
jgi:hypothetical protein